MMTNYKKGLGARREGKSCHDTPFCGDLAYRIFTVSIVSFPKNVS